MLDIFTKKSISIFTLTVFFAIWVSKWNQNEKMRDYWDKIPRFNESVVDFDIPNPRDQRMLFETVNEIVSPVPTKVSGKIPDWLKGM